MPSANSCPECRETIHPFAATCASCGADLDAHRRRRAAKSQRRLNVELPRLGDHGTELAIVSALMLLLSLFAPLFGLAFSLLIVWQANNNGDNTRRNIAILCAALAIFNIVDPSVLLPHLL